MAKRLKTIFNKPRPHRFDVFIKSLQNLGHISATNEQCMFYILVKRKAKEYRSNRVKMNPQNGQLEWNSSIAIDCKLRQKKDLSWESKVHTFGLFMVAADEDLCLATAKLDLVDFVGQLRSTMSLEFHAVESSRLTSNPTVGLIVSCILVDSETSSHQGFHSRGGGGRHARTDSLVDISDPVWTDGPSGGLPADPTALSTSVRRASAAGPTPNSPSDKVSWKAVKLRRPAKPRFNGDTRASQGEDPSTRSTAKSHASHFSPRNHSGRNPATSRQSSRSGVARLQRHGRTQDSPSPPLDDAPSQPDRHKRSTTPSLPPEIQPPNPPQEDSMSTTSAPFSAANTRPPLTTIHPSFTQPPIRNFDQPISPRDRLNMSSPSSQSARNLRTSRPGRSKGSMSGGVSPRSGSKRRHGRDRSFSDGSDFEKHFSGKPEHLEHFAFGQDDTGRSSTSVRGSPTTPRSPYADEGRRQTESKGGTGTKGDSVRLRQGSNDKDDGDYDNLPPPTPDAPAPLPSQEAPELPPPSAKSEGHTGGGESDDDSSDDEDQIVHKRDVDSMKIGRTRDYQHTTPQELLEREEAARQVPSTRTRVKRTESESEHLMFSPPKELAPTPFDNPHQHSHTQTHPHSHERELDRERERRVHTQPQLQSQSAAAAAALRENAHDAMRIGDPGGAYDIDLNRSVRVPDEPENWASQNDEFAQPAAAAAAAPKSGGISRRLPSGLAKALRNAVQGGKSTKLSAPMMERSVSAHEVSRSDFSEPSISAPQIPRGSGGPRGPNPPPPQHMHGIDERGMPHHMHQQMPRGMMVLNGRSVSAAPLHISRMNRGGPLQVHGGLEHSSAIHQSNIDPFHPANHIHNPLSPSGGAMGSNPLPHPAAHGIPALGHQHIASPLSPLDYARGMRGPQPYSLSRSASSTSNVIGKDPYEGVDLTSFMSLPHRYKSAYHQVSSGQNVLKRSAKFLQRLRKMQEQFAAQVELLTKTELEKCRKESTDTSSPFFLGTMKGLDRLGEIVALRSKMDAQHLLRISEPFKQYQAEVDPRYKELVEREAEARKRINEKAKEVDPKRKEVQPIVDKYLQARKRARLNPSWTADLLPEETKANGLGGSGASRHQSPQSSPLTVGANSNKSDQLLAQAAARLAAQKKLALPSATMSEPEIVGTAANRQNLQITHRMRQDAIRACQTYEKALNPVRDMEKTMRQVELPDILYKMQQIEESRMSLLKEQISSLEELFGTVDADHYPYPLSDTDLMYPDTLKDVTVESQVQLFVRRTLDKHGLAKDAKSAYPHALGVDTETLMRENERYEQYQRYCHSRAILEIGDGESHETLDELVEETWYRAYLKSPTPSQGGESVTNRKNREQKLLDDSISRALKDVNDPRLTSISLYLLPNTRPELYFSHFLQKSFCHENIEFYHAATRWLDDETLSPSHRMSLQNNLFDTYLDEDAQSMVNLPYKCHHAIVAASETDDPDALVRAIREAQHEVVALMSVDSFRKFLKSKIFLSFLQQEVDRLSLQEKNRRYHNNLKLSGLS